MSSAYIFALDMALHEQDITDLYNISMAHVVLWGVFAISTALFSLEMYCNSTIEH